MIAMSSWHERILIYDGVPQNLTGALDPMQLLGELLLDRANVKVMMRYVGDPANLKLMMILLKDSSRSIQFEAFHVFKAGPSLMLMRAEVQRQPVKWARRTDAQTHARHKCLVWCSAPVLAHVVSVWEVATILSSRPSSLNPCASCTCRCLWPTQTRRPRL